MVNSQLLKYKKMIQTDATNQCLAETSKKPLFSRKDIAKSDMNKLMSLKYLIKSDIKNKLNCSLLISNIQYDFCSSSFFIEAIEKEINEIKKFLVKEENLYE